MGSQRRGNDKTAIIDPAMPGLEDSKTDFVLIIRNPLDIVATLSLPWKRVSAVGHTAKKVDLNKYFSLKMSASLK